jgi:hypothetical protein
MPGTGPGISGSSTRKSDEYTTEAIWVTQKRCETELLLAHSIEAAEANNTVLTQLAHIAHKNGRNISDIDSRFVPSADMSRIEDRTFSELVYNCH